MKRIPFKNTDMWKKKDENFILVSEESGDFFQLEGTSTDIWKLIDGSNSVEDIIHYILKNYRGVSKNAVEKDIMSFISELDNNKLIYWQDSKENKT